MAFKKTTQKVKKEVTYKVIEDYGVIPGSDNKSGYQLKLRFMSWYDNEPVYDLRPWKNEKQEEKCLKGLTFSGETLEGLYEVLKGIAEEEEK